MHRTDARALFTLARSSVNIPISYYWSTYQHEWALDIIFQQAADLRHFYPRWINHAMTTFSSPDVMRFLGKRITDVLVGRCALQPDEF